MGPAKSGHGQTNVAKPMICIPTRNPNKWWTPILETTHIVMAPILDNFHLSMRCNAAMLQNQGDCDIVLDNGFTLEPGQSYMMGNYNELNTMIVELNVAFIAATAPDPDNPTKRLEVVEVLTKLSGSGLYIDQPVVNPL